MPPNVAKFNASQLGENSRSIHSANSAAVYIYQHGQQAMSLFTGAVIHGGQISISINSLNESPSLTTQETALKQRYKRLRAFDLEPFRL